jgi:hypothetical protein
VFSLETVQPREEGAEVCKVISEVSVSEVNAMVRDMCRLKYDTKLQITQIVSSLKSDMHYSFDAYLIGCVGCCSLSLQTLGTLCLCRYFEPFKYLCSILTNGGRCTCEIKSRIAIAKAAFNKKRVLLTSTLGLKLRKKLVKCYIWSIALYGAETWMLRTVDQK